MATEWDSPSPGKKQQSFVVVVNFHLQTQKGFIEGGATINNKHFW